MEEQVNNTEDNALKSIGGTLLLARTEAGLSQDDIAKRLNLAKSFIEFIENDEFERLEKNPVFIRGYVRSYARLVSLPDNDIVALLNATGVCEVATPTKSYVSTRRQITARDKKVRLVTYGIVILILILIFAWWHKRAGQHLENKNLPPIASKVQTTQPGAAQPILPTKPNSNVAEKIKSQLKMDNGNA